jgi:PhoH-like ATPase
VQPSGLQLRNTDSVGKLHFQLKPVETGKRFGNVMPDNLILGSVLQLMEDNPGIPVVLVSKDINLRIKASICNITAEDYENDRAIDDFNLLFTGATELPADFWERHEGSLRSWTEKGRTFYEVKRTEDDGWFHNQFLYLPGDDEVELKVASSTTTAPCCRSSTTIAPRSTRCGASTRATASRTSPSMR